MRVIRFPSFRVIVPAGWADITDSIEVDGRPFTLAHPDGVGALQFSVALYQSGEFPHPSPQDLYAMVKEFGAARGLGKPYRVVLESEGLRMAAGSFDWGDDYLRVWQVSDGRSFAFITYVCESGQEANESAECEEIVRSLEFAPCDKANTIARSD